MIKAVLFDLDDTLTVSQEIHYNAWIDAGKEFGIVMTPEWLEDQQGRTADEAAKRYAPPEIAEAFAKRKEELANERYKGVALTLGASEALQALRAAGLRTAIVTSSNRERAQTAMKEHPVLACEVLVVREDFQQGKPHPEGLLLAAKNLGVPCSACVYVGDAKNDALAAKAAGMRFVLFGEAKFTTPRIIDHRELLALVKT